MNKTSTRIQHLRKIMSEKAVDALFICNPTNRVYLSGFDSSDGILFVTRKKVFLILDRRYASMGRAYLSGIKVISLDPNGRNLIRIIREQRIQAIGYDQPHRLFPLLRKNIRRLSLKASFEVLETIRIIKDHSEVQLIRKACKFTDDILRELIHAIHEGMTEWEIQKTLHGIALQYDQFAFAFSPIVAIGKHTAYPHYNRMYKQRKLTRGDTLLIDFGIDYEGYKSDMSRILFFGVPSRSIINDYEKLCTIQKKIICSVKPGIKISDTVLLYRRLMKEQRWTRFIKHGLGHGVGLAIHEEPSLTVKNEREWQTGMVVALEPGIYRGQYGMRIEDTILVGKRGPIPLTKTTKEKHFSILSLKP